MLFALITALNAYHTFTYNILLFIFGMSEGSEDQGFLLLTIQLLSCFLTTGSIILALCGTGFLFYLGATKLLARHKVSSQFPNYTLADRRPKYPTIF
jgi:hypothetical protein